MVQGGTFSFLTPTIAILSLPKWQCPSSSAPTMVPTGNIHIQYTDPTFVTTKCEQRTEMLLKAQITWPEASKGLYLYFILAAFLDTGLPRGNGQEGDSSVPCEVPSLPNPTTLKVGHTSPPGTTSPTLSEQWCGFFYVPQAHIVESAVRRDLRFFVLISRREKKWRQRERPLLAPYGLPITHALSFI